MKKQKIKTNLVYPIPIWVLEWEGNIEKVLKSTRFQYFRSPIFCNGFTSMWYNAVRLEDLCYKIGQLSAKYSQLHIHRFSSFTSRERETTYKKEQKVFEKLKELRNRQYGLEQELKQIREATGKRFNYMIASWMYPLENYYLAVSSREQIRNLLKQINKKHEFYDKLKTALNKYEKLCDNTLIKKEKLYKELIKKGLKRKWLDEVEEFLLENL